MTPLTAEQRAELCRKARELADVWPHNNVDDLLRSLAEECERLGRRLDLSRPHPFGDNFDAIDIALKRIDAYQDEIINLRSALAAVDARKGQP